MINFTDMSAAALKLANDSKRSASDDAKYLMYDVIYRFIKSTSDACDNIDGIAQARKEFCDKVYTVKDIDPELYRTFIRFNVIDKITQDNVHACMVSIIKLAELLSRYYAGSALFNDPALFALRDSLSIIPMVNSSFYYKSRVAQVYYTVNTYDAIIMDMVYSGQDPTVVRSKYNEMLIELYCILIKCDYHGNSIESDLHNCISDNVNRSFKHISILHSIATSIDNMITGIRADSVSDDYSIASAILEHMQKVVIDINSKINNARISDFSSIAYYIKKYIGKSIESDTPWNGKAELTSNVQCIAEDNKYELSAFDSQCVRAVMTFNTCVEDINMESAYASTIYTSCISALCQLINAHTIVAAADAANSIAKLLPSCKVSKSISISTESEAEKTEKCTGNEEPDEKNESTDDPSECHEWIEELSTAVSEMKDITNSMLPKNSMEEDSYKGAVKQNISATHLSKEDREKWNEPTSSKPISWNEYFMELAETAAKRSKDPNSKVGACIMDPRDHRVVSLGYNGFPYGCSDDEFPWSREGDGNKYLYVVHAELNAILSARKDLTGCVLFVTYSPCNECMKAIIQSGIKAVVYKNEYKPGNHTSIASTKMAKAAGVSVIKYGDLLETGENFFDLMHNNLLKNFEHETE